MSGDSHAQFRDRALRLLARREHSVQELSRKLRDRGCPSDLADVVAGELVDEGLLSDRRFAEEFVRARRRQGYGPLRIRAELGERGVDDDQTESLLRVDEDGWLRQARSVRVRRFGEPSPDLRHDWLKQARYLANRGFTRAQIRQVLGEDDSE